MSSVVTTTPSNHAAEFQLKFDKGREYLRGKFDMTEDEYLRRFDKNRREDRQIQRFVLKLKSALGEGRKCDIELA